MTKKCKKLKPVEYVEKKYKLDKKRDRAVEWLMQLVEEINKPTSRRIGDVEYMAKAYMSAQADYMVAITKARRKLKKLHRNNDVSALKSDKAKLRRDNSNLVAELDNERILVGNANTETRYAERRCTQLRNQLTALGVTPCV